MLQQWFKEARVYLDHRVLAIGILGFFSGLPYLLVTTTLGYWIAKIGLDLTTVGLFSLLSLPYVFSFLWSPLVDQLHLPLLTSFFGQRRAWMMFSEFGVILGLFGIAFSDPLSSPQTFAFWAFFTSIFSATFNTVFAAYRTEILNERSYGAGAATSTTGYRIGMLVAGGGAIHFASIYGWQSCYVVMAILMSMGIVVVMSQPEPFRLDPDGETQVPVFTPSLQKYQNWLTHAIIDPFKNFMQKPNWPPVLALILLFKASDGLLEPVILPFFQRSLQLSDLEISTIVSYLGLFTTILGGFLGGILINRLGIIKMLVIATLLEACSNLGFIGLLFTGDHLVAVGCVVAIEHICQGVATIVLIAYLSQLCTVIYAATQYALLWTLASVGSYFFRPVSGYLVDRFGWLTVFVATLLCGVPAIILAWHISQKHDELEQETS